MQNRENNLNFMSNFSGENQTPKMSPIGQGTLHFFNFQLINLELHFIIILFLFAVSIQQQQRLIQMQRTVVPNRMIGSQQIIQQGTVQQTRQLAPPPPYPGPPPPYPGQHQVKYYLYYIIIHHCYSV